MLFHFVLVGTINRQDYLGYGGIDYRAVDDLRTRRQAAELD